MTEFSPEPWGLWTFLQQEPSLDEDPIKEDFLEESQTE